MVAALLKKASMAFAKFFFRFFIFLIGFILGASALSKIFFQLEISFINSMDTTEEKYWSDWEHRLSKVVLEEEPEVAAWAIKSYITVIEEYFEPQRFETDDCASWMPGELAFSYSKLATLSKENGTPEDYSKYVEKALSVARICHLEEIENEKTLLAFSKTRSWK